MYVRISTTTPEQSRLGLHDHYTTPQLAEHRSHRTVLMQTVAVRVRGNMAAPVAPLTGRNPPVAVVGTTIIIVDINV